MNDYNAASEAIGFLIGYALVTIIYLSVPVFVFLSWLKLRKMHRDIARVEKQIAANRCK